VTYGRDAGEIKVPHFRLESGQAFEAVPSLIKIKIEVNGDGQDCLSHTNWFT